MADPDRRVELESALDRLVEAFGAGAWAEEVVRARDEYAARTGRVFEDDELFEARTAAFLEWYAVERPLSTQGVPPAALGRAASPADAEALSAWLASHRSLSSIEDQGDDHVLLYDLIGGGLFEVDERRRLHGVADGDLVEARLVGWEGKVRFGRTFLYHPAGAREAIIGHARRVKDAGGSRADIVDFVASLRVRALRYKHVAAERVYEMGTSEFAKRGLGLGA
jgi:hypothetical protein